MPALPQSVIAPAPEVRPASERQLSSLAPAVVAPAPELDADALRAIQAPNLAIIEPPPNLPATSARRVGDIDIGRAQVIVPAPQLPVAEQRVMPSQIRVRLGATAAQVVPPPPALANTETSPVSGRLIALGIHPAAMNAPIEIPAGNRRGTFAATPEGKRGAPGTPSVPANSLRDGATDATRSESLPRGGSAANPALDIPAGLFVGPSPGQTPASTAGESSGTASQEANQPHSVDRRLLAGVTFPQMDTLHPAIGSVAEIPASEVDKAVFGPRHFYSMTLNMPNLNSVGGSWVIRFAELREDRGQGVLVAPVATQKVDPAYPAELMRQNVQGTVTLYAVIHSDGHVGEVRVLRGVDRRLDGFACAALARWHFRPATKNGNAVALEAVVTIPFRAGEER